MERQLPDRQKIIREIKPSPVLQARTRNHKLRVAAYCRVSTDQEEQQTSIENQIAYYEDFIHSNPEWEYAGVFSDDGISGTRDENRPGFMEMIKQCKKGKIDMILAKSLSRFSRNTLQCISYIRMLKDRGIIIRFEKEGLDTSRVTSEIFFTWTSAFAQGESESLSNNVKWGKRKGYSQGKFTFPYTSMLGYKKGEDGHPEIVPEEAEHIKMIFNLFLLGRSLRQIKEALERRNILTPRGNTEWGLSSIEHILRNEKYMGDVLLQKSYTADFLTKKKKKNNGELTQYYITDNHPAIIPREDFLNVQLELTRRNSKKKVSQKKTKSALGKYCSKYALSERLVCGECGSMYRRTTWVKKGKKKVVWRCISRLECGTKYCQHSPTLLEEALQQAILQCVQSVVEDMDAVREAVLNALIHRDYSFHTEGMPIQLVMYSNRMEIINPGGLYGRLTVDRLGQAQPDTRNPALVTAMETLGKTENRYSGIPTIRYSMKKHSLPEPQFVNTHGSFKVVLYNEEEVSPTIETPYIDTTLGANFEDEKGLIEFCRIPRTRAEIIQHLEIASGQYALRRYLDPLIIAGAIRLTIPDKPRSKDQRYVTAE